MQGKNKKKKGKQSKQEREINLKRKIRLETRVSEGSQQIMFFPRERAQFKSEGASNEGNDTRRKKFERK